MDGLTGRTLPIAQAMTYAKPCLTLSHRIYALILSSCSLSNSGCPCRAAPISR